MVKLMEETYSKKRGIRMKKSNIIEVKTKYTEEAFYRFNRVHYRFLMRHKKIGFILLFILSIPAIILYLSEGIFNNYWFALLFVLIDIIIVVEVFTNLIPDLQVKRTLKRNKEIVGIENTYRFKKESFEVRNKVGSENHSYDEIYQVLDIGKSIYIYLDKVRAYIVELGNEDEKIKTLLKEKLGKSYRTFSYKEKTKK